MRVNNAQHSYLSVVFFIFSVLLVVAVNDSSASTMRTAAIFESSSSVQFSSWRLGSGNLSNQSSLGLSARTSRSLVNNVSYTLNTAVSSSSQSSYTFRPSRAELSSAVDYSYAAATQSVSANHRHHRGRGTVGPPTTPIVAGVPDAGSSLLLFVIALSGFAALRLLPAVSRSVRR